MAVAAAMTMSCKGEGTSSSPIVLVSDLDLEPHADAAEVLVQVSGSPLKVICSERYR